MPVQTGWRQTVAQLRKFPAKQQNSNMIQARSMRVSCEIPMGVGLLLFMVDILNVPCIKRAVVMKVYNIDVLCGRKTRTSCFGCCDSQGYIKGNRQFSEVFLFLETRVSMLQGLRNTGLVEMRALLPFCDIRHPLPKVKNPSLWACSGMTEGVPIRTPLPCFPGYQQDSGGNEGMTAMSHAVWFIIYLIQGHFPYSGPFGCGC